MSPYDIKWLICLLQFLSIFTWIFFSEMQLEERSLYECHKTNTGTVSPLFSVSLSCCCCLRTVRWWYLLLWISFVLITRINEWFGFLNASFRETWLSCHDYELQTGMCFTWGSLSSLPSQFLSCIYTHLLCVFDVWPMDNDGILLMQGTSVQGTVVYRHRCNMFPHRLCLHAHNFATHSSQCGKSYGANMIINNLSIPLPNKPVHMICF